MAGQKILKADEKYATRLAELIQGKNPGAVRGALSVPPGLPLNSMGKLATIDGATNLGERALAAGANYGLPVASAGLRYGVPIAGAMAVSDGVDALYNVASQTPVFGQNPADVDQSPNLMVSYVR